jgi:hypothetical protein
MVFKALELSHRPSYERLIDVPQQGVQRLWGISPVVLNPTPQEWIELAGNVLQRQLCLTAKFCEVSIPESSTAWLSSPWFLQFRTIACIRFTPSLRRTPSAQSSGTPRTYPS